MHVVEEEVDVVTYNVFSPSSCGLGVDPPVLEGHSPVEDAIQFLFVYAAESDGVVPLLFSAVPYVLQLSNGFDMAVAP